ncbi:MAG: type II secretion system F family protein [Candidatus Omnitrophota bacterium]
MGKYKYKAINNAGQFFSDTMPAESASVVAEKLKSIGLKVIFVKEIQESDGVSFNFLKRFDRVKPSELNLMTRQFAVLQKAGVSIVLSLESLSAQLVNKKFKGILAAVVVDIKAGKSLSAALENYPDTFGPLYVNMLKAGEESGTLVDAFEKLADLGEYEEKVNARIKAATRYPVIVLCAIVVAFLALTVLVVPRFANIYNSAGVELPLPTLLLIGINGAITHYWWLMILVLSGLGVAVNKYINTKQGRYYWDSVKLKIPVFGPLMAKIIMGRFAKITGTLLHTGVPILRILDLAASVGGSVVIEQAIEKIKTEVKNGNKISGAMKATGMFPPVVVQMASVGEDTGKLSEMLLHVSGYYDGEVNYIIENITALIEPMLLLILGSGVLTMALGIFLPMWNMMSLFKR